VFKANAENPTPVLPKPVVFAASADDPTAVLLNPDVLEASADIPMAVLLISELAPLPMVIPFTKMSVEKGLPPPLPLYCGIFNVFPTRVAAPLVPVVVKVNAPCFELKVVQSLEDKKPLVLVDAKLCEWLAAAKSPVLAVAALPRPKLVLPVAATKPVAPPSHFNLSLYAVFQLAELSVIDAPQAVPVDIAIPAEGYTIELMTQDLSADKSKDVPLIVNVREVGTPPKPLNV
jgi:hypothetical protein